jgi:hypothetical protein
MTKKNVCRQTLVIMTGAIALGLAMLATGCGKFQTNPTADFNDVAKNAIPADKHKPGRNISYLDMIFPNPDTNGAILNFNEGESKSYPISFNLLMDGVDYQIHADNLPEGATLNRAPQGKPSDYILAWTPKVGATQGELKKDVVLKLHLVVLKTYTTEASKVMSYITKEKTLVMSVIGSKEIPVIEKLEMPTDLKSTGNSSETAVTIQKGESVAFTVTIKDLSVTDGRAPQLYAAEEINGMQERPLLKDASQHVSIDRYGKSLGNGRYQFTGRFSSEGVEVKDGKQIAARFALVPVSNRRGADKVIEIDIAGTPVAAPSPTPAPTPGPAVTPAVKVAPAAPAPAVKIAPVVSAPVVKVAPAASKPVVKVAAPAKVKEKKLTKKQLAAQAAAEKKAAKAAAKKAAADKKAAAKKAVAKPTDDKSVWGSVPLPGAAPAPAAASSPAQTNTDKPADQTVTTGAKS